MLRYMITALQDDEVIVSIHMMSYPPKPVQRDQNESMLSDRE
jgi:hypothetical protein